MATETVTVMFTDLVGSTALLSAVGERLAEDLRREHFGLLRAAVEPAGGREVKNLGDGLMVVFASAADAVTAGVAVQRAFERRNRRAAHPLLVRVGISLGDADVEDGDFFGRPVVEAARLCAQAQGGDVLVADVVRLLAGSRAGFEFEPVGDLALKGFDEPVAGCRVVWSPLDEADHGAPFPSRLAAAASATFVGRDAERVRLAEAWKRAANDDGRQVLLVSGEPGIGKTTLAARVAAEVHADGAAVVYGRCDEDLGIPYQPWIEALGQLVRQLPDQVLDEHHERRGGSLARLLPDLAHRFVAGAPTVGDAETERFVLFGCVSDLLVRATREQPLLIVLDDLHWVDRPTVQLLRHVVTADEPMRLAVLGTFRDSDVTTGHPLTELLAGLHRERGVERVSLSGLTDTDLLALLEQIAGHEMTDPGLALRDAVLAETAGNPFFVGEILRHLAETGLIYRQDDGRWGSDVDLRSAGLPVSVREVVGRRLAGLGPDAERVLTMAAVIGRNFDLPTLAAVTSLEEDALIDLCDAAASAAILQTTEDPDRYIFAHALIEHTLYDGLSPARRARAHRAIAEQLEAHWGAVPGERAGELAHHWAAAVQPTDTSKAVYYACVAGARALDQLAPDEAVRWYRHALELLDRSPDDPPRRVEILLGLGDAEHQVGDPAYRQTLLDAAHLADQLGDVDSLVRAALANNRGFQSSIGAADDERLAVIDLALARIDDPSSPDRARLLALSCAERVHAADNGLRMSIADDAVATARRSGDHLALLEVLRHCVNGIGCEHNLDQQIAWIDEACMLADELGEPVNRYHAHSVRARLCINTADRPRRRTHLAVHQEIARLVPHAAIRWSAAFNRVDDAILDGDLDAAEQLANAAFTLGYETGQPDPMGVYAGQLLNIRDHQGRIGELVPLIEQAVADTPLMPVYRAVLAHALVRAGDDDRARTLLADAVAEQFVQPVDGSWSTAMVEWAWTAVRLGDGAAADIIRNLLAPFPDRITYSGLSVLPAIAHYLGTLDHLLGRHDDADRWFTMAMALHERIESPLLIAYTQAAWSSLCADLGDTDRARNLATAARAAAVRSGFGYIEADARAVLARID
jgi:class 3 adenylate cyclase